MAIESAERAYNSLSYNKQLEVSNREVLFEARETYDELVTIKAVEDKINAIGIVTRDSFADIQAAQDAYDALLPELQARVGNHDKLIAAQEAFREWEVVAKVEEQIRSIGRVTLDSLNEIQAAQDAYDALTPEKRAQVRNYNTLTAAWKSYERLVQESKKDETIQQIVSQLQALPDSKNVSKDDEDLIRAANEAYTNAIDDVRTAISKNYKPLVKNLTACVKTLDK